MLKRGLCVIKNNKYAWVDSYPPTLPLKAFAVRKMEPSTNSALFTHCLSSC